MEIWRQIVLHDITAKKCIGATEMVSACVISHMTCLVHIFNNYVPTTLIENYGFIRFQSLSDTPPFRVLPTIPKTMSK